MGTKPRSLAIAYSESVSLGDGRYDLAVNLPVSQARHDLGFNILLDIRPGLAIFGCLLWQELLQVTRLDIGYDAAVFNGIVVLDNLVKWSAGQAGESCFRWGSLWSMDEMAASLNSLESIVMAWVAERKRVQLPRACSNCEQSLCGGHRYSSLSNTGVSCRLRL